jgi:FecR protein
MDARVEPGHDPEFAEPLRNFMVRSKFIVAALLGLAFAQPAHAQTPLAPGPAAQQQPAAQTPQASADEVGNVASVQGATTVTRNGTSQGLKLQDPIFKGDVLRTSANATLGIIFDDETTFNLSANASIEVNEFVYESGGKSNSALFNVARGTVAFAANQVAKTGDMKIATPSSMLGIRGTTGVIEVPEGATPGSTGEVAVKLYQDEDGRVGRIELFGAGGGPRLGLLTRAATGFTLRAGAGGRFAAVPLTITAAQIARDRGFVQRTFAARNTGRQMINQRQKLRTPGLQRQQPNQRQQNLRQQNRPQNLRQQGGPQRGAGAPNQRGVGSQNAPRLQNQPGSRNAPSLQRQNLQRTPAMPRAGQPARKKLPVR